jgi:hypothetical protein
MFLRKTYTRIVNFIHCRVDGQKFVHVRNTQQDAKIVKRCLSKIAVSLQQLRPSSG